MKRKGCYLDLPTPTGIQRWRVAFEAMSDRYGEVEWAKRIIRLNPNQGMEELVDTVTHEVCHVCTGDAWSEEWCAQVAAGVTLALLRLKCIKVDED